MILPGSYLEYIQDKKLLSAVCLRQDKGEKIFVRNVRGCEEKLDSGKARFVVAGFISPNSDVDTINESLQKANKKRDELANSANLPEIWELLLDEGTDRLWNLEELSDFVFNDQSSESLSALYRALEADGIYFIRKGNDYLLRSREQVEEIFNRQRIETAKKAENEVIDKWLTRLWHTSPGSISKLEYPQDYRDSAEKILREFAEAAIRGTEYAKFKDVTNRLKALNITRRDAPLRFMIKAGLWDEDENLLLHKTAVSIEFSTEEVAEASRSAKLLDEDGEAIYEDERLDLTSLECFTIDDISTTDIDDALSFEEYEDGSCRVGIHIADASNYVIPGTLVDESAKLRGTAIYLPDLKIPMCPEALSESVCSLVAGKKRLAFSFLVNFDNNLEIVETKMVSSVIRVTARLTYNMVDEFINNGEVKWCNFLKVARKLGDDRKKAGAIVLPYPRVNVKVDKDKKITIERENPHMPAQVLVSEMMILANSIAGKFLYQNNIPAIFRSQEPPEQPIGDLTSDQIVEMYQLRKFMKKGVMGMKAARHTGLGLDSYVQITSPIRRYNDLLMQRQLKACLRNSEPLYTEEELDSFLAYTSNAVSQADYLERDRRNYWILRYLEEHQWEDMEAIVLANHPDKHIVQICNCLWENECPHVPGHPLPPGTHIHVSIESVWPRDGIVRLNPIV